MRNKNFPYSFAPTTILTNRLRVIIGERTVHLAYWVQFDGRLLSQKVKVADHVPRHHHGGIARPLRVVRPERPPVRIFDPVPAQVHHELHARERLEVADQMGATVAVFDDAEAVAHHLRPPDKGKRRPDRRHRSRPNPRYHSFVATAHRTWYFTKTSMPLDERYRIMYHIRILERRVNNACP